MGWYRQTNTIRILDGQQAGALVPWASKRIGRGNAMTPKRINVWVQRFKDRPYPMLQWHDPDTGRRKSVSAGTADPKAIEKARADLEYELNHNLHQDKSKMTWERFTEIYTEERLSETGGHNQALAATVLGMFERLMRPKNLGAVNERMITAYGVKLRELGRRPSTVHAHFRYMKAALRWAASQKFIHEVPRILMPKVPKGTTRAKVRAAARLTQEEYERLLMKAPNDGWRLLIAFAWHAGLRLQEARNVHADHIDLDAHLIHLPANKAGDVDAVAFITPELDAMLRAMFPDGFPRRRLIHGNDVPWGVNEVSKGFIEIAKAAAVKGGGKSGFATLHDLRRAYGTRWAGKVPAQVLQRMMRHANISTTLTFYADTEQAALAAVWGPANPSADPSNSPKTPGKSSPSPKSGQRNTSGNSPFPCDAADST